MSTHTAARPLTDELHDALPAISPTQEHATLPIDQIGLSPLQHRQFVSDADRERTYRAVQAANGIVQPLIVRRRPTGQDRLRLDGTTLEAALARTPYELVDGEQRWTAGRRAGLTEVDVIIRDLTDDQVIRLGLNLNGSGIDLHPLEEAAAYHALQGMDPQYSPQVLAESTGSDASTVRKRLKLNALPAIIKAAFRANAITVKQAEKLSTLPEAQQLEAFQVACFEDVGVINRQFDAMLARKAGDAAGLTKDERVAGLNTRPPVELFLHRRDWETLKAAQAPIGVLEEWVRSHTTVDLADPDTQIGLPGLEGFLADEQRIAEGEAKEDEGTPSATQLRLSLDPDLAHDRKRARQLNVLVEGVDFIRILSRKDRCPSTRVGCVVHPAEMLALIDVCADRKGCGKHWPEAVAAATARKTGATTAKASAPKVDYEAQQRERDAEKAQWEEDVKVLAPALVDYLRAKKLRVNLALVTKVLGIDRLKTTSKNFGVTLTEGDLALLLALDLINTYSRQYFLETSRPLGFDAGKVLKTSAAAKKKAGQRTAKDQVGKASTSTQGRAPAKAKPTAKKRKGRG